VTSPSPGGPAAAVATRSLVRPTVPGPKPAERADDGPCEKDSYSWPGSFLDEMTHHAEATHYVK
jgi:hypothetical protein